MTPHARTRPRLLALFTGALTACPQGSYLPDTDTTPVDTSTSPTFQPTTSPDPSTETGEPSPCNMNATCDAGESPQTCPEDCKNCGNGEPDDGEVCDEGADNSLDNAYHAGDAATAPCNSSCTGKVPFCGDSVCQSGPENTMACPEDGCLATCGDGLVEGAELCDDGNLINADACLDTCQPASCGDSFVWDGVEACDDANPVDTDACVMCSSAACGDGFTWAGVEDCDDANMTETDACDTTCKAVIHRKVFVSSLITTGALDGLYGADLICQTLAESAGLTGTFQAWISDGNEGPVDRLDTSFTGVYELVDGTVVAHGWADLTDGSLDHPINLTEKNGVNNAPVWTNTTPEGEPFVASHCLAWESNDGTTNGWYGSSGDSNVAWTQAMDPGVLPCNELIGLYCFEDPG